MSYDGQTDKKEIIARLLSDFPSIIKPNDISIEAQKSKFRVSVFIQFSANILLEIDSKLANITNTDELQENLFSKLSENFRNGKVQDPVSSRTSADSKIDEIVKIYSGSKYSEDLLTIHYPDLGMKTLQNINYKIIPKNDPGLNSFSSSIKIAAHNSEGTVLLNDVYPLSLYKKPNLDGNSLQ